MIQAIRNKNIEFVKLLLSCQNIDINKQSVEVTYDDYGGSCFLGSTRIVTPFFLSAFSYENYDIMNLLMSNKNLDLNIKTEVYQTLLSCAVEYNNVDLVKRLLTFKNIDVNALVYKHDGKQTVLYLTAETNNIEIIKLLLLCENIDVNIQYKSSNMVVTPLNIAIYNDEPEVVKLLLSFDKIDVNIPYEHDYTESPLFLCIDEERTDVLDLLLERDDIRINELTGKKKFIYSDEVQVLNSVAFSSRKRRYFHN